MLSAKPWRVEAVIQFCAALIGCLCLGAIGSEILRKLGVGGFSQPDGFGAVLLATLSFQGAAWVLILIFLRQHRTRARDGFGLRDPQVKRALLLAALTVLLFLPVAWLLQSASFSILTRLGREPKSQLAVTLLENADSVWLRAYLGVFAVAIAPVAEEFIFRGMLYPFVKQLGFPRLALLGTSGLFALIHFDTATFVPLFALALMLAWLYEATDNLLAPIAAHALFNGVNLLVLILKQLDMLPAAK